MAQCLKPLHLTKAMQIYFTVTLWWRQKYYKLLKCFRRFYGKCSVNRCHHLLDRLQSPDLCLQHSILMSSLCFCTVLTGCGIWKSCGAVLFRCTHSSVLVCWLTLRADAIFTCLSWQVKLTTLIVQPAWRSILSDWHCLSAQHLSLITFQRDLKIILHHWSFVDLWADSAHCTNHLLQHLFDCVKWPCGIFATMSL